MTKDEVERFLCELEERNDGWVHSKDLGHLRFKVFVDDKLVEMAGSVNRRDGKALTCHQPPRVSEDGSEVITYEVHGEVRLEQMHD